MSVEEIDQIDIIGIDPISGEVILTVADQLDWSDEYAHLTTLQEKLNTYMAFIETGEMGEQYPQARGRHAVIVVVFQHAPPPVVKEFVKRASLAVRHLGAELRLRFHV